MTLAVMNAGVADLQATTLSGHPRPGGARNIARLQAQTATLYSYDCR